MNRRSNANHMTGREHDASGKRYPFAEMQIGDWFTARCPAQVLASAQNKKGPERWKSVVAGGQNIVVRAE